MGVPLGCMHFSQLPCFFSLTCCKGFWFDVHFLRRRVSLKIAFSRILFPDLTAGVVEVVVTLPGRPVKFFH